MTDPCLSESTILAFVQGSLVGPARDAAERHLASCDECRAVVAVLARSSLVDVQEARTSPEEPSTLVSHTNDLPMPADRVPEVEIAPSVPTRPPIVASGSRSVPFAPRRVSIGAAVAIGFFVLLVLYVIKDALGPHAP